MTREEFLTGEEFAIDRVTRVKYRYREGEVVYGEARGFIEKAFLDSEGRIRGEWEYECNAEEIDNTEFKLYNSIVGEVITVILNLDSCKVLKVPY